MSRVRRSARTVEDPLLAAVRGRIKDAGDALRDNDLPRLPVWDEQVLQVRSRGALPRRAGQSAKGPAHCQRALKSMRPARMSDPCATLDMDHAS